MTPPQEKTSWKHWVEPWYLSYALLGVSAAGLAPILLPLAISATGNIAQVGLVVALFNLGGLIAPVWGGIADRSRSYRAILIGGLLATTAGFALFPLTLSLPVRLLLALAQGGGAAAAATVGNMLIVEAHPREEWDKRIGWLQTFYGVGQVGGLLLAGLIGQVDMRGSLIAAAALTALAVVPAWSITKPPAGRILPRPLLTHPARHAELSAGSPQQFHHHLGSSSLRNILRPLVSPFGGFLIAWLLSFAGAAAFFSLYPVIMQEAFGIQPSLSSPAFAVAAALGLLLYPPAGSWSGRVGPMRVLQAGFAIRLLAFGGLFLLGSVQAGSRVVPALLGFLLIVLAWSFLSVAGTAVSARAAHMGEGEALGLYNAVTAVAGVIGAALAGWLASQWGYTAVPAMGIIGIALGMIIVFILGKTMKTREEANQKPSTV
ncbi:MAG: MFS transporter [Bacteroidota bacterium]